MKVSPDSVSSERSLSGLEMDAFLLNPPKKKRERERALVFSS